MVDTRRCTLPVILAILAALAVGSAAPASASFTSLAPAPPNVAPAATSPLTAAVETTTPSNGARLYWSRTPTGPRPYFGARYYGSRIGRFTTVDPVYNWSANLVDPQRWNRYAYGRNNPLKYVDPDGREVTYANAQLQTFFGFLSARSASVRGTLGLFTGPGKPDLFIQQADAGKDIDGTENAGVFSTSSKNYGVDYTGKEDQIRPGMTAEQIEDLGAWSLVGQSTLTLDSGLTINVREKRTIGVAVHELGHADQAARQPLGYKRDAAVERNAKGKIIEHDKRPAEVYANKYRDRALKEVNP